MKTVHNYNFIKALLVSKFLLLYSFSDDHFIPTYNFSDSQYESKNQGRGQKMDEGVKI